MQTTQKIKIVDKLQAPFTFVPNDSNEELTIMWNVGELTNVKLDEHEVSIGENCILFVSEFYMTLGASTGTFSSH